METENSVHTEKENLNDRKEIKRSASYPALTVIEAFRFAETINEKFSISVEVSREEVGHVFGLHPNTLSRDIAAAVQFGFLSKTINGKYKLTELFSDAYKPESEKEKKIKLITAFGTPKLYQELITKLDNQVIPLELPNTLVKHHGITEAASKSAAEIFIKAGQEVGVINESRALKYQVTLSTASKLQYTDFVEVNNDEIKKETLPSKPEKPDIIQEGYVADTNKKIPIYLTKDKVAYLLYPNDVTASDIAIIDHQLKGILLRIQLENDEKKGRATESPS